MKQSFQMLDSHPRKRGSHTDVSSHVPPWYSLDTVPKMQQKEKEARRCWRCFWNFFWFFVFWFFWLFRATPVAYGSSQARELPNWSCSCQLTPQPEPHRIRDTSATYTSAHSNAGSFTHGVRPGIEPATSWRLVRHLTIEP